MLYPPLAGLFGFALRVWQRGERAAKRGPCDARQARRAVAAWAAGGRLAKGIGRPPLPVRTSVRVATRPCFGPRRGDHTRACKGVDIFS
jgi:hypothetical protein